MKDLEQWKKLDKSQIQTVIDNYVIKQQKLSEAGTQFNLDGAQVRNLLKANNIKQRKNSPDRRKYKMDDNYFDVESSNMAYILGFWAADGNVHTTENRLDLELSSVDYEILEKIQKELKVERPIKIYQCANGYTKNKLLFWSKHTKEKFIEYGIVPNKTYSKDFHAPYKLDKKYWIDYIRGFFDGDGSVKKGSSICFELNSVNLKFLQDIQDFLQTEYNIQTNISTTGMKNRNIPMYRLYCYGERAKQVFNILYTPNSLYLKRKYERWLELL